MGQIVAVNAKPRRANLQAIRDGGTLANEVLQSGECVLIDSTNGKSGEGYGRYDSYIVGDGTTACNGLKIHTIGDIKLIDIGDVDTLNVADMRLNYNPAVYIVTAVYNTRTYKVGTMQVFSDSLGHVVTEVLLTHYLLDDNGEIDVNSHSDSNIFQYYRSCKINGGTLPVDQYEWTTWKDFSPEITTDSTPVSGSVNPVQSGGVYAALAGKQETLVSGTNIKTINDEPILGDGNINVATDISGKADKATTLAGYGITDSYTKTEVDAIYESISQSGVVVVESADWPLSDLEENTIYRVQGTTSYSDYMYDGTSVILLATYSNAIDNVPTENSNNLAKSGGIYSFVEGECYKDSLYDAEIEYIQTSGTQYLSTGYAPSTITPIIEIGIYMPTVSASAYPFGADGSDDTRFSIGFLTSARIEFRIGGTPKVNSSTGWHVIKLDGRTGEYYLDGVKKGTSGNLTFGSTMPMLLFTSYEASGNVRSILSGVRISYFKLWDGDTLLLDLIPVRIGQTGYMLDKVTTSFLSNAGTGNFLLGNDKPINVDIKGQIVGDSAKIKRGTLKAIQSGGSLYSEVLSSGEILLINTSNSLTAAGSGIFDAFIIGDGTSTCGQLDLHYISPGSTFMGVADTAYVPDTSKDCVFYILLESGTYTNMGGIIHDSGIGMALWNGKVWSYLSILANDVYPTEGSNNYLDSAGVFNALRPIKDSQGLTPQDEFIIADESGNIGVRYNSSGFDVANVAPHLVYLIKDNITQELAELKNPAANVATLGLISDMHADSVNLRDFIATCELYGISNRIHLGDTTDDYNYGKQTSYSFWTNVEGHNTVMNIVGNHDSRKSGSGGGWNAIPQTQTYDCIINPFVSTVSIVQPQDAELNGLCYYYKDLEAGVRLICIDCMYWDQDEYDWLSGVLADSKTNSKHVLIACHYPTNDINLLNSSWNCRARGAKIIDTSINGSNSYLDKYSPVNASDLVQDFIDGGGIFIGWICGHQHRNWLGQLKVHPTQLQFCIPSSNYTYSTSTYSYYKLGDPMNQYLFTFLGIDTSRKLIKAIRIGKRTDIYMQQQKQWCYDYQDNVLLYSL